MIDVTYIILCIGRYDTTRRVKYIVMCAAAQLDAHSVYATASSTNASGRAFIPNA